MGKFSRQVLQNDRGGIMALGEDLCKFGISLEWAARWRGRSKVREFGRSKVRGRGPCFAEATQGKRGGPPPLPHGMAGLLRPRSGGSDEGKRGDGALVSGAWGVMISPRCTRCIAW